MSLLATSRSPYSTWRTAFNGQGIMSNGTYNADTLLEKSSCLLDQSYSAAEVDHHYSNNFGGTGANPHEGRPYGSFSVAPDAEEFNQDPDSVYEVVKTEEFEDLNVMENSLELHLPELKSQRLLRETDTNFKSNRLSLGKIPIQVRCYSCESVIKEDCFAEHLLFGTVRCSHCHSHFEDCHKLIEYVHALNMGSNIKCCHTLEYVGDTLTYITRKLLYSEVGDSFRDSDILIALENYMKTIKSLENRSPWKYAIQRCKDHVALKKSQKNNKVKVIGNTSVKSKIVYDNKPTHVCDTNRAIEINFSVMPSEVKRNSSTIQCTDQERPQSKAKYKNEVRNTGLIRKSTENPKEIDIDEDYLPNLSGELTDSEKMMCSDENNSLENKMKTHFSISRRNDKKCHKIRSKYKNKANSAISPPGVKRKSSENITPRKSNVDESNIPSPSPSFRDGEVTQCCEENYSFGYNRNAKSLTLSDIKRNSSLMQHVDKKYHKKIAHDGHKQIESNNDSYNSCFSLDHEAYKEKVPAKTLAQQSRQEAQDIHVHECNEMNNYDYNDEEFSSFYSTYFLWDHEINNERHTEKTPQEQLRQETSKCETQNIDICKSMNSSNSGNKHPVKEKERYSIKKKKIELTPRTSTSKLVKPRILTTNLPADGFYYISRHPIDECPNCYCTLNPTRATVNCKTFLITVICSDCNLVIYIGNENTAIVADKMKKPVNDIRKKKTPSSKRSVSQKKLLEYSNPFIMK